MWNLAWITKTAVGVLYVNFAFLVLYFPRFILLAARVITGPNIITTSFSLYTHTLIFFNSLLDPVIYGWRMRQIRHAIMDTLLKVYTNRELWFWTVREILILQSTVLFRVHSNCHFGIQFFVSCFLISDSDFRCLKTSDLGLRSIPNLVQMETLSNFSFLWEVSVLFFGSVRFWKP